MRMLPEVNRTLTSWVHADLEVAGVVDLLDGAELAVCNTQVLRWRCELGTVAFGERALYFLIRRHTRESARIVALMLAVFALVSRRLD